MAAKTFALFAAPLLASVSAAGAAQAWERSFAADTFQPAAYYAGKAGNDEKAADCPNGLQLGIDVAAAVSRTAWRTEAERKTMIQRATQTVEEAQAVQAAPAPAPAAAGAAQPGQQAAAPARPRQDTRTSLAYRGFAPDINTYYNPMAAPDPGMQEVVGKIAYGFDLDGKAETGGFVSPEGETGIDNSYYRALGCTYPVRGAPGKAYEVEFSNDHMRDGLYTLVVRITGQKDPLNDDDVTVEIGYSPDDLVKDARGGVAPNYSFRFDPQSGKYTSFKAAIVNGVVTPKGALGEMRLPDFAYMETLVIEPLVLHQSRFRMTLKPDGTAEGLIGGYRKWSDYYAKEAWQQPLLNGSGKEDFFHMDLLATYHALVRNADGLPDPKTGRKMGISAAYSFTAIPAIVMTPDAPLNISYAPMNADAKRDRDIFRTAVAEGKILRDDHPMVRAAATAPRTPGTNVQSTIAPAPAAPAARAADVAAR